MLFLMNDAVLSLEGQDSPPPLPAERLRALSLSDVLKLGAELYAEKPLLHHEDPERAKRLALLVAAKAPQVNAALFVAPEKGCAPEAVISRLAELSIDVMAGLQTLKREGGLNPVTADRQVWRRLAA